MITINTPYLEQNCESIYLKSNIVDEVQNINEIVWFQTSLEFGKFFVDEVADPFLVALVMPAIRYKEDITVNAKVSEQLYYNLVHYVIPYISASWGGVHAKDNGKRVNKQKLQSPSICNRLFNGGGFFVGNFSSH